MRQKIKKLDPVALLNKAGLSPTIQRVAVLRYLLIHENHPTVDMIYQSLKMEIPTLSKTTVYNTLKLFKKNNLALAVPTDEDEMHYDIGLVNHMHFVCRKCGNIYDMRTAKPHINDELDGHLVEQYDITMRGTCKNCRKQK